VSRNGPLGMGCYGVIQGLTDEAEGMEVHGADDDLLHCLFLGVGSLFAFNTVERSVLWLYVVGRRLPMSVGRSAYC
jgi:hypothetical protein